MAYSVLMFARNNRNSALQRCLTMLAVKGNANDEVFNFKYLHKIAVSLPASAKAEAGIVAA